jgi:hypothetical protein
MPVIPKVPVLNIAKEIEANTNDKFTVLLNLVFYCGTKVKWIFFSNAATWTPNPDVELFLQNFRVLN